eukprot:TRINITY_DN7047_c0_g1_i1.p1 TRINITY_DN7047_c0_g1~~TRINITY_DN7047_c0_g1_i1.p1  ORF type:complete len:378 (-),score=52.38 TRINITY_DN7047_c0_g1_i1:756-1889(-)
MNSFVKFLCSIFGSNNAPIHKVLILGLDAAGKTTIMYSMKKSYEEVLTTIPTIGFNVETVLVRTNELTCWDVGGCDKIRPLWKHYTRGTNGVIFVVDSNDKERLPEAAHELEIFMRDEDLIDVPFLILANKQDLPHPKDPLEVAQALDLFSRKNLWGVFGTSATQQSDLVKAFEWLESAMEKKELPPAEVTPQSLSSLGFQIVPKKSVTSESQLPQEVELAKAKQRDQDINSITAEYLKREDENTDEFLEKLYNYQLESWDHYTHLRIAWELITRYGIKDGTMKVEDALRSFIINSSRTNGKSFHPTMTRFWCHMIAYAICCCASRENLSPKAISFKKFLASALRDYELWDKNLFAIISPILCSLDQVPEWKLFLLI